MVKETFLHFTYLIKMYQEMCLMVYLFLMHCLLSKSSKSVLASRELICLTDGRNSLSGVEFGL